jgi:hypothetical protein
MKLTSENKPEPARQPYPRYEALNLMQLKVNMISGPEFGMNEQIFRL